MEKVVVPILNRNRAVREERSSDQTVLRGAFLNCCGEREKNESRFLDQHNSIGAIMDCTES